MPRVKAMVQIPLLLLLCWPLFADAALAEDASVLLRMYGYPVYDPAVEGDKLSKLEEDYAEVSRKVNNQRMLSAAYALADQRLTAGLIDRDKAIYALEDRLKELESAMSESMEADVATILAQDASYRTLSGEIERQRAARNEWLAQAKHEYQQPLDDMEQNASKLSKIEREVGKQKIRYEQAQSYPELGEISSFRSLLESPASITSPFGERLDPIDRDAITFHQGIDLAAPAGTQVRAAFHGVVEQVSESEELGIFVILDHGLGIRTLYGHLDSARVEDGQRVNQYDPIAKSGNTGTRTTGPHLHFGLYIDGKAVNPAKMMSLSGA